MCADDDDDAGDAAVSLYRSRASRVDADDAAALLFSLLLLLFGDKDGHGIFSVRCAVVLISVIGYAAAESSVV